MLRPTVHLGRADGLGFTGDLAELVIVRGDLSDNDFQAARNTLAVSYGLVPEPSSLVLLLAGGLLLFARRSVR